MESKNTILPEIEKYLRAEYSIPKATLMTWIHSADNMVLGSILEITLRRYQQVAPALTLKEQGDILVSVALRIIGANSKEESDYASTDYEAAEVLQAWLLACYKRLSTHNQAAACLGDAKNKLAQFYQRANGEARRCLVNGVLEHIFETKGLREEFDDWRNAPNLAEAYQKAREWGDWKELECQLNLEIAEHVAAALTEDGQNDVIASKSAAGGNSGMVEWTLADKRTKQQLLISSFLNPSDALKLIRDDSAFARSLVEYAIDRKNWQKVGSKLNTFSVRIPGRYERRSRS
jgi:hypothetical protein